MKYIAEIFLIALLISLTFNYHLFKKTRQLSARILVVQADAEAEMASQQETVLKNCSDWVEDTQRIQKVAGCYEGMELLCSRAKSPSACMETFNRTCREIRK